MSVINLGIIGGGQLGKMLLYSTRKLDIKTKVLDPDNNAPGRLASDIFVQGDLTDYQTVYNFGKDVDVMISRDTDSRVSHREMIAVNKWLESDKGFHIMRDHPWHTTKILGGMWGCRKWSLSEEIQEKMMSYEGGLKEFVKYLDQSKKAMIDEPISLLANKDGIEVNLALWWNDSYYETVNCFTNNIPQKDGGTHLAGLRGALTRVVNSYAQESGMSKKENVQLVGDDIREGLTCVLSIKVADPKFSSQTKDELVSSEVRPVVES